MPAPCTYTGAPDQLALVIKVERRIDAVTASGQTEGVNKPGMYDNLETAGRLLLRTVDDHILLFASTDGKTAAEAGKVANGTVSWIFPIPADFLRFLRVELDNHDRAVDELRSRHSPLYKLQANPEQANDAFRPFAVLLPDSSAPGKQSVELFPYTDAGDIITAFEYVPSLCPEGMITDLVDPVIWYAAGLTLLDTDQPDRAPVAFQAAAAQITNLKVGMLGEDATAFEINDAGVVTSR